MGGSSVDTMASQRTVILEVMYGVGEDPGPEVR